MNKHTTNGLFAIEKRTVPAEDMTAGILPTRYTFWTFVLLAFAFIGTLFTQELSLTNIGLLSVFSILLARLITVDLSHMILPNIYILPIAIIGLIHHIINAPHLWMDYSLGALAGLATPFAVFTLSRLTGRDPFIGGGDIKMMIAAGIWLGISMFFSYLFVACLMTIAIFSLKRQTDAVPFGPGLCLALWVSVVFGPKLLSLIS